MRIEVEKMLVEKKNDLFWKFGSFTFEIKKGGYGGAFYLQ